MSTENLIGQLTGPTQAPSLGPEGTTVPDLILLSALSLTPNLQWSQASEKQKQAYLQKKVNSTLDLWR